MKHIALLGLFAGVYLAGCATQRVAREPDQPIVYHTDYKMVTAAPGMEVFTDENSQVITNLTTFYTGTIDRWIVNVSTQDLVIEDPRYASGGSTWDYEYPSTNGFGFGRSMWGSVGPPLCGGCIPTQVLKAGESYFLGKEPFDFELPVAVTAAVYHAEMGLSNIEEACEKPSWYGKLTAEPLRIPLASYRANSRSLDYLPDGYGTSVTTNQAAAGPVDWTQSELLSMVSKLKVDMPREDVEKIVGPPVLVFLDQYGCKGIYYISNPDTFIDRKRMRMRNGPYSFTGLTARFVDEKLYMVDYNPSWIDQDRLDAYIKANPVQDGDVRSNSQNLKWDAILDQRVKQAQKQKRAIQMVHPPFVRSEEPPSELQPIPPF